MWRRWIILAAGLPLYTAFMAWLLFVLWIQILVTPGDNLEALVFAFSPHEWELDEPVVWLFLVLPAAIMTFTQAIFIIPTFRFRPQIGRATSLKQSIIVAGLVATVLMVGLVCAIYALMQLMVANQNSIKDPMDADLGPLVQSMSGIGVLAVMVGSWIVWSTMLLSFARQRQGRGLFQRIVGLLLAGTVLEVLIVLPVDIMIRRRTNCYCGSGTFWSLILSAWALLWLAGPGVLIALTSKRRSAWWETHCEGCGYEKGPSPGQTCPECGHQWREHMREAASGG